MLPFHTIFPDFLPSFLADLIPSLSTNLLTYILAWLPSSFRSTLIPFFSLLCLQVKDPVTMKRLWSLSTAHSYHDFTTVFTQDALDGWLTMRKKLAFQEIVSREGLRRWHEGRKEWNINGKEGSIFLLLFSLFLPLISPSFFLLLPPLFYLHFVSFTRSFILFQNFYFLSLLRLVHRPKI